MAATKAIELRTAIPGPRSQEILERKARVIADPLSVYMPVVIDHADGATLTDVDGNTFLDFTGGVGCLNVGHANARVTEAVQEQAARFLHTDFTIVPYEVYVTLGERLVATAPISGPVKAAFFNAGTEAVENAVKFARAYTKRPAVIAFEGGFHGRTLLSLSLTSKTHPYKAGLGPFAPDVYRVPFAQDYRGPDAAGALAALERALVTQVAAESVAAVVIEPVQGEGGFVVAPPEFLAGVRRICDDNGIVLVVDEVQTGFGRTGKLWGIEHYDVEPDLMCVAKSIAAGLPLSGVLGRAEIMDAPGDSAIGETMRARMLEWQERFAEIGDVRGLGAMLAIELVHDRDSKEPAPELVGAVCREALHNGLLLLGAGIYSNAIRVLVPLTIADGELDEALDVWERALEHVLAA